MIRSERMRELALLAEILAREVALRNHRLLRLILRDIAGRPAQRPRDPMAHLQAAMEWLCRAQDAAADGGVSRSFCVAWHPYFRTRGWLPAYPETTGYIIPTMFDYAALTGDDSVRARAVRMADWEIAVQMPNGAVQGGVVGMSPSPAVFNTGQVIFGWLRAARETRDERYLRAAERAGRFLLECQDADGSWRRGLSQYAKQGPQTYNTRTAWALIELADVSGDRTFAVAGIRNIDAALARQLDNGWFAGNCLDDDEAPLTHTIAYATRGVLESGRLLDNERYLLAARRTADAVCSRLRRDGSLAGRYDRRWDATVQWSCMTGNAQMSIIWLHLWSVFGEPRYLEASRRCLRFIARRQDLHHGSDGVRGGIAGSYPISGSYGRFEYLNWAAKFFAEAILTELRCGHVERERQESCAATSGEAAVCAIGGSR